MKLPTPIKTDNPVPWGLSPSEMAHTLSVEYLSPWINLLSLYYGSLLNSFLCEAKNPYLAAHPRDSPETWDVTILSGPTFLQQNLWMLKFGWTSWLMKHQCAGSVTYPYATRRGCDAVCFHTLPDLAHVCFQLDSSDLYLLKYTCNHEHSTLLGSESYSSKLSNLKGLWELLNLFLICQKCE